MELIASETAIIDALSHYIIDGVLDTNVTVGELVGQTGLSAVQVNGALCRLMGRDWLDCQNKYVWTEDDCVRLAGEGLSRASAAAARRELTLYEVKIGELCFYISYEEPRRSRQHRQWIARAHRADAPGTNPAATASGITRARARDAVLHKLRILLKDPDTATVPCDHPETPSGLG